jgi:hypothetical protein
MARNRLGHTTGNSGVARAIPATPLRRLWSDATSHLRLPSTVSRLSLQQNNDCDTNTVAMGHLKCHGWLVNA